MDRRDYTMDWYRKQDFQRPNSGSFEGPGRAVGRLYAPSDSGDYRGEHAPDRRYVRNYDVRNRSDVRNIGHRYAPSDTGDYRGHPQMEPSPDYIEGVRVLPKTRGPGDQMMMQQKSPPDIAVYQPSRYHASETFDNLAYEPDDHLQKPYDTTYASSAYAYPGARSTDGRSGTSFIMYDGKGYKETEVSDPRPSWIDKMYPANKKADRLDKTSVCTMSTAARLIVMLLIVWDLVNDWLLASSGPISFLTNQENTIKNCVVNTKVFNFTGVNVTNVDHSICSKAENLWDAFAILALLGSLVSIIQLFNIGCEMIMLTQCRPKVFQVLHGQSEVLLSLFFEELPQICLMTSVFYICDCHQVNRIQNIPNVTVIALLASLSAATSTTARYITSFRGISEDGDCCNTWWRSSCCENKNYCCRLEPKNLFCTCNVPCPLCCCTLHCSSCKWTPRTWCAPLMKAFSCFCDCCREDEEMFGIRLVNLLGIIVLWTAVGLNIFIFIASGAV